MKEDNWYVSVAIIILLIGAFVFLKNIGDNLKESGYRSGYEEGYNEGYEDALRDYNIED